MKFALNVPDRLMLLNVLPKEGNITSLRVVRELAKDIGFSEDDLKRFEIQEDSGGLRWNMEKDEAVEVEIGARGQRIIHDELQSLSKKKKLKEAYIELYERFVENAQIDVEE